MKLLSSLDGTGRLDQAQRVLEGCLQMFSSLRRWLDEWQLDVGKLQGRIDGILSESGFTGL